MVVTRVVRASRAGPLGEIARAGLAPLCPALVGALAVACWDPRWLWAVLALGLLVTLRQGQRRPRLEHLQLTARGIWLVTECVPQAWPPVCVEWDELRSVRPALRREVVWRWFWSGLQSPRLEGQYRIGWRGGSLLFTPEDPAAFWRALREMRATPRT